MTTKRGPKTSTLRQDEGLSTQAPISGRPLLLKSPKDFDIPSPGPCEGRSLKLRTHRIYAIEKSNDWRVERLTFTMHWSHT